MMTQPLEPCRVLIVEDEAIVQLHLRRMLTSLGYEVVGAAASADEAVHLATENEPDLVLMDIKLRGEVDDPAIVFLTAFADEKTVQRTEQVGAVGYIVKPYSRNEMRAVLATALGVHRRMRGGTEPAAIATPCSPDPAAAGDCFHGMIGRCAAMKSVFDRIRDVARLNWVVLIEGGTGTGKELTARALHAESPRAKGPFIAVNCAGLSDTLLTSQLFGHKKGTFTGAVSDQQGFFESAHGGTLFLDEIADISAQAQQALLRVLEDGVVQRIGDTVTRPVDVRIVSATQRDLAAEVAAGRFRADLLYRLRAVRLNLPLLRERGEDILLLANEFRKKAATHARLPVEGIDAEAAQCLSAYPWPGNVRELRHAVDHAVLACRSGMIGAGHLPAEIRAGGAAPLAARSSPEDERGRIRGALLAARGNRAEAARLLGISRATLYRRFAELNISPVGGEDDDEG
jgi:DNA-binding NtrC family response regulator